MNENQLQHTCKNEQHQIFQIVSSKKRKKEMVKKHVSYHHLPKVAHCPITVKSFENYKTLLLVAIKIDS